MFRTIGVIVLAGALSACASHSEDIAAAYVSPLQYQSLDCVQIAAEMQRVRTRAGELAGAIDESASDDAIVMGVGIVLFVPALLFLEGDGPEASEFANLKGEEQALQTAATEQKCSLAQLPAHTNFAAAIE